ncbi:MAG: hypothetical protein JW987_12260 [Anaerolineaceae bacterium]|nr:hypothetical protein [Anaerolineaceae bacterium]
MLHLSLKMFGSFQASLDDRIITGFDCVKTRALLAYIAEDPGQAQWRSMLSGFLWPERMESAAQGNLRHTLTTLRHLLRNAEAIPPFLLIDRETVTFNSYSCFEIDTCEFRNLLQKNLESRNSSNSRQEYWEKAISLYKGNFLENFLVDDCPGFEEWILARREYYNSQMLETLFKLAETCLGLGQYKKGETYAHMQLHLAPWKEEAYQQLMKALALQGRRSDALMQYFYCRNFLSRELGVDPSQESQRLFQLIQAENLPKPNTTY